jgi:hypothetical protein
MFSTINVEGKAYVIEQVADMPKQLGPGHAGGVFDEVRADVIAMKIGEVHRLWLYNKKEVERFRSCINGMNNNKHRAHSMLHLPGGLKMNTTTRTDETGFYLYYQVVQA